MLCRQRVSLSHDEIQSGFGRTGRWFAHQRDDFIPDIMVMAKGLASGFPLSGIAYRSSLMNNAKPGSHGGTYGGNAVACAAAAATVRVIRDQSLVQNSASMGEYLIGRLRDLQSRFPVSSVWMRAWYCLPVARSPTSFAGYHRLSSPPSRLTRH
jgi:4-aminobutyrate aminotransferase